MTFEADLARFAEKAQMKQEQALRKTAIELFGRVIMRTPVDTGRLRGNWQATVGSPADYAIAASDNASPVNSVGAGSSSAKTAMMDTVLGADRPTMFWLTNTLPYASVIEYEGHSHTQAPQGMVRISVAEFADVVDKISKAL